MASRYDAEVDAANAPDVTSPVTSPRREQIGNKAQQHSRRCHVVERWRDELPIG